MSVSRRTVLVAVDPSIGADPLVRQAAQLAASYQARLIALSVTPSYGGNLNRLSINEQELSEPGKECLQEAAAIAAAVRVPLETIHLVGDPADAITETAAEMRADFLVIGSPRPSQFERLLLGMATARIISESPCDVLLMPPDAEVAFNNILVGIDGSRYSMAAGQRALDLGMAYGGTVHALTVIDLPADKALRYGVMSYAHGKGMSSLQVLAGQGEKLGVKVKTALEEGIPYKHLIDYTKAHNIDLVVMGSFGRTALQRTLLGSVVERVGSLCHQPTLVVRALDR